MYNKILRSTYEQMVQTGLLQDEKQAKDIFWASLIALRDRLPKNEALHLGSLLPMPLHDAYFDGWDKNQRPIECNNKSDFLAEVMFHLKGYEDHSLSELVPLALNSVLKLIGENEADHLIKVVPRSYRDIFSANISMD